MAVNNDKGKWEHYNELMQRLLPTQENDKEAKKHLQTAKAGRPSALSLSQR